MLDKCYEEGELHWDSADMYMDSEDLLGKHWCPAGSIVRDLMQLQASGSRRTRANASTSFSPPSSQTAWVMTASAALTARPNTAVEYAVPIDSDLTYS